MSSLTWSGTSQGLGRRHSCLPSLVWSWEVEDQLIIIIGGQISLDQPGVFLHIEEIEEEVQGWFNFVQETKTNKSHQGFNAIGGKQRDTTSVHHLGDEGMRGEMQPRTIHFWYTPNSFWSGKQTRSKREATRTHRGKIWNCRAMPATVREL